MDEFWLAWAKQQARQQWGIYKGWGKPPPEIKEVVAIAEPRALFRVTFVTGDVFDVAVHGIASPTHMAP